MNRMHAIALDYGRAPLFDACAEEGWRALAADSVERTHGLRTRGVFVVTETDDPEPYADAVAMFNDLNRGRFTVTRAHSDHPLWTVEENVAFRIVHDIAGHYATGGDFSWHGENLACGAHELLLPADARRALFTECIGQTAYANVHGDFGPQKVAYIS